MKKLRNLHNGFQDSSGKTMTEVATPRTEATPAATPKDAVEHRRRGRQVHGGGRIRGRKGHKTRVAEPGRSMGDNPTNLTAIKENNDLPCSTDRSNHVNTKTTAAARARKPPPQPKTGKPANPGHPSPTTLVQKTATPSLRSTSTRTTENRTQDHDHEDDEQISGHDQRALASAVFKRPPREAAGDRRRPVRAQTPTEGTEGRRCLESGFSSGGSHAPQRLASHPHRACL